MEARLRWVIISWAKARTTKAGMISTGDMGIFLRSPSETSVTIPLDSAAVQTRIKAE